MTESSQIIESQTTDISRNNLELKLANSFQRELKSINLTNNVKGLERVIESLSNKINCFDQKTYETKYDSNTFETILNNLYHLFNAAENRILELKKTNSDSLPTGVEAQLRTQIAKLKEKNSIQTNLIATLNNRVMDLERSQASENPNQKLIFKLKEENKDLLTKIESYNRDIENNKQNPTEYSPTLTIELTFKINTIQTLINANLNSIGNLSKTVDFKTKKTATAKEVIEQPLVERNKLVQSPDLIEFIKNARPKIDESINRVILNINSLKPNEKTDSGNSKNIDNIKASINARLLEVYNLYKTETNFVNNPEEFLKITEMLNNDLLQYNSLITKLKELVDYYQIQDEFKFEKINGHSIPYCFNLELNKFNLAANKKIISLGELNIRLQDYNRYVEDGLKRINQNQKLTPLQEFQIFREGLASKKNEDGNSKSKIHRIWVDILEYRKNNSLFKNEASVKASEINPYKAQRAVVQLSLAGLAVISIANFVTPSPSPENNTTTTNESVIKDVIQKKQNPTQAPPANPSIPKPTETLNPSIKDELGEVSPGTVLTDKDIKNILELKTTKRNFKISVPSLPKKK